MAAIEFPVDPARHARIRSVRSSGPKTRPVLCLPKGLVDPGEKALDAALREVREETGITAEAITKLADIKYVYVRSWGDKRARVQDCELLPAALRRPERSTIFLTKCESRSDAPSGSHSKTVLRRSSTLGRSRWLAKRWNFCKANPGCEGVQATFQAAR